MTLIVSFVLCYEVTDASQKPTNQKKPKTAKQTNKQTDKNIHTHTKKPNPKPPKTLQTNKKTTKEEVRWFNYEGWDLSIPIFHSSFIVGVFLTVEVHGKMVM